MLSYGLVAQAQLTVGYMNPQEVLDQLPERDSIGQELQSFINQKQQQLQQRNTEFQQAVSEFQEQSSSMSEQERQQREQELANREQQLRQYQQEIQTQIQQKRSELLEPLLTRMDEAIKAVADSHDLDFVINKSTSSGESVIFYAAEGQKDITQEVLNKLKN